MIQSFKVTPYRAPSWSWASQNSWVDYDWFDYFSERKLVWDVQVLDYGIECLSDDVYGQVKGGYISLEGRMIELQIDKDHEMGNNGKLFSRQGEVRICYVFSPDDSGLVTTDKVFWCILLKEKQLPEVPGRRDMPKWSLLMLVVRQIDGGMNFERVGYVCDCAGSYQVQTLWDGVESTRVTLV
jgi:hypothetical protein